jgi:TPP-dependent indolepyruvate ferredoxin oxidoreductase alpha subunit
MKDSHVVVPKRGTDATSLTGGAQQSHTELVSGNEAVGRAAFDAGVRLGTGYPGTPATEILEAFDGLGGRAQWAPNEKVALEVALEIRPGTWVFQPTVRVA